MTLQDTQDVILKFFNSFDAPGLKLPDGWVGKPYDNQYRLTDIWIMNDRLGLELNSINLLTVSGNPSAEIHEESLQITGFDVAEWKSIEAGESNSRPRVYTDGVIEFINLSVGV